MALGVSQFRGAVQMGVPETLEAALRETNCIGYVPSVTVGHVTVGQERYIVSASAFRIQTIVKCFRLAIAEY